jgi:hypothetical protein
MNDEYNLNKYIKIKYTRSNLKNKIIVSLKTNFLI